MKKLTKKEILIENINLLVDKEKKFNEHVNELDTYIEETNNLIENREKKLKDKDYYSHPENECYAQSVEIVNKITYIFMGLLSLVLFYLIEYCNLDIPGGFWRSFIYISIVPTILGTINIFINVIFNKKNYDTEDILSLVKIMIIIMGAIFYMFALINCFCDGSLKFHGFFSSIWSIIQLIFLGIVMGIMVSIGFLVSFIVSFLILYIVSFIINKLSSLFKKSNKNLKRKRFKKLKKNYDNILKNLNKEILEIENDLKNRSNIIEKNRDYLNNFRKEIEKQYDEIDIPNTYRNYWTVLKFKEYFDKQLVENLKECYKKFDLDQQEIETRKILNKKLEEQNEKFEILEAKTDEAIKYAKNAANSASLAASRASDAQSAASRASDDANAAKWWSILK